MVPKRFFPHLTGVADPHHFDADPDPDPAFHFDANPDPDLDPDPDPGSGSYCQLSMVKFFFQFWLITRHKWVEIFYFLIF